MGPLLEGLLRTLGGSEANFLELCFGRLPYGDFHTKETSKKFRPPSGNFRPNPPELPRSPSRSDSSQEAGRKIVLIVMVWKATKEYLNQRGTKIRVFRVCFQAPFLPPFFPHFPPSFPSGLVHSHITSPLFTSPFIPPFLAPEKSDLPCGPKAH